MPFPLFFRKNRLPGDPGASPAQGGGKYRNENESKDSGPNEKGENSSALELARTMGEWDDEMDVGQNGRPRGPQMEMSSLVLTIQLLGYLILTHTQMGSTSVFFFLLWKNRKVFSGSNEHEALEPLDVVSFPTCSDDHLCWISAAPSYAESWMLMRIAEIVLQSVLLTWHYIYTYT